MIWQGTGEKALHKRSGSQNMPEHKPSSSVILSYMK